MYVDDHLIYIGLRSIFSLPVFCEYDPVKPGYSFECKSGNYVPAIIYRQCQTRVNSTVLLSRLQRPCESPRVNHAYLGELLLKFDLIEPC